MTLIAPFPWFGGKRRVAAEVWTMFGDVPNYVEPFAGSLAVLLQRPSWHTGKIETINDLDMFVANFWRALSLDPEAVALHADWPVNEADLFARHLWLVNEGRRLLRDNLDYDPEWYDARIAGWWVWGQCAWIGSGWMSRLSVIARVPFAVPGSRRRCALPLKMRRRRQMSTAEYRKTHRDEERAYAARYRAAHKDEVDAYHRAYVKAHPEVYRAAAKRDRKRHPEQQAARNAVAHEVVMGRLPAARTLPCAHCGKQARGYHHASYESVHRLNVIALCRECHNAADVVVDDRDA